MNLQEISGLKNERDRLINQIHDLENSNLQLAKSLDFYKNKTSKKPFVLIVRTASNFFRQNPEFEASAGRCRGF